MSENAVEPAERIIYDALVHMEVTDAKDITAHDITVALREKGLLAGSQTPKVEIVHGRDPDSECELTVFVNGEAVEGFIEEDIDPGRGYTREDWDERIEDLRDSDYSPAFKAVALDTLEAYSDSEFIT